MMRRLERRLLIIVGLALAASCRSAGDAGAGVPKGVEVSALFVDGAGHELATCLKDWARSYVAYPDGILFFDPGSTVSVKVPRGERAEPYHVHVLHRVAGEVLDQVVGRNDSGRVEVDLSRYDDPEAIVVASAPLRLTEGRGASRAVVPPYAMSLKLIPRDQAEALIPLQNGRVELETPWGTLYTFVRPFNRRDMFVSWVDPKRTLRLLVEEEPYVYLRWADGYLAPRLVVEVATGGTIWQRAGTWPMPEWVDRLEGGEAEKPFVLRTPERELFAFGAPARLDLRVPEGPVGRTATIEARFRGLREGEGLKFALGCAFPIRGAGDYGLEGETHEVVGTGGRETYTVALDRLEAGAFPLTAAVTHRLIQPWALRGGMFRGVPPLERVTLGALGGIGRRILHPRVVVPRCASHYEFVSFFGDVTAVGKVRSPADAWRRGETSGPGPNVMPPGPGISVPPPSPPTSPPLGPEVGGPMVDHDSRGNAGGGIPGPGGSGPKDDPPPPGPDGRIEVTLPCPGKGGCGMQHCTCPNHTWTQSAVMQAVWRALAKSGPADISFFGSHGSTAPCHRLTHVGTVRVTYWGVGFQLLHYWYQVEVTFQPCMGIRPPPPPPPPVPPPQPPPPPHRPPPGEPGSGGPPEGRPPVPSGGGRDDRPPPSGDPFDIETGTVTISGDLGETESIPFPYNDPEWTAQGYYVSEVFGSENVPTWAFSLSSSELSAIRSGFGDAYHGRPLEGPGTPSVAWSPSLTESWAVYQPGTGDSTTGGPGGGSGGGPPPSPPPPSPPPPTCDPWDYYCTGQTKSKR
jgi:hypothetical protein